MVNRFRSRIDIRWVGGTHLIASRGMTGLTGNVYYGFHEFHEMASVLHILRPGDTFADVGANAGAFTVLASRVAGARTVAIEPGRAALAALRANIAANDLDDLVTLQDCAVGAESGDAAFTEGDGTMNRLSETGSRRITLRPLDSLVSAPTMIKIDIEGGEAAAFQGARETLQSEALLCIITESHDAEITAFLSTFGFTKHRYDALTRQFTKNAAEQGNAWFVRDMDRLRKRIDGFGAFDVFGVKI